MATGQAQPPASPKELSNALYACCAAQDSKKVYFQEDFLGLKIVPNDDIEQLLGCLSILQQQALLKLLQQDGRPCWKVVNREDAAKYKSLSTDEAIVYSYIESSGRQGIWVRTITTRSNLHAGVITRCLKSLENRNLIKPITNAAQPKKKTYILSSLQPSEDVTGGPFYTDGVLDEEFVHHLCNIAEKIVLRKSWYQLPSSKPATKKKSSKAKMTTEEAENMRNSELSGANKAIDAEGVSGGGGLVPMPPGYMHYPRIPEITKAVNETKITSVAMKEAEIQRLMEILCWDGRVVKVLDGEAFKAVKPGHMDEEEEIPLNGLTEAPCGRCPVFELCEEGGPVNARTCTYFQDWLRV